MEYTGLELKKLIEDQTKQTGKNYAVLNDVNQFNGTPTKFYLEGGNIGVVPDFVPDTYQGSISDYVKNYTDNRNNIADQLRAKGIGVNDADITAVMNGQSVDQVVQAKQAGRGANDIQPGETPAQWQARQGTPGGQQGPMTSQPAQPNGAGNGTINPATGQMEYSGGSGGSQTSNSGTSASNPDLGPYADLYKQMQDYLDKLQKNGQIINPNVQITPDQLAAFATQAAGQIHPFYATQLAAATDSFLSGLGYNTDQFKNSVNQAQTQYGRNLDALGSTSADQGFAQSGIRQKKEGELASDTQNNLDQLRGSLFNNSQNSVRQFATTYGGANVPGAPTLGAAPRVLPGQSQFDTSGSQQGLYSLDPSIYQRLIGTEQNSEKQATDTLASQLATNKNQLTANTQARSLL